MRQVQPEAVFESLKRRIGELSGECAMLESALRDAEARAETAERRLADLMQAGEAT